MKILMVLFGLALMAIPSLANELIPTRPNELSFLLAILFVIGAFVIAAALSAGKK